MRASQACPHVSLYLELSGNNIAYYSMNHRPPSSIGTEQGSHDAALTAINGRQGAASSAGLSMPLPQVQPQPQLGQQHHRQGLMHDHNATSGGGRTVEVHPFASQVHHTPCMAFQDPRYALPGGTSSSNNPHLGLTAHLLSGSSMQQQPTPSAASTSTITTAASRAAPSMIAGALSARQQQQVAAAYRTSPAAVASSVATSGTPDVGWNPGTISQKQQSSKRAASLSSGVIRVPCPARGLPADHNAKTALFELQQDTPHGAELLCSHRTCRSKGIRFLYCAYCRCVAFKRNFSKKHGVKCLTASTTTARSKATSSQRVAQVPVSSTSVNLRSESNALMDANELQQQLTGSNAAAQLRAITMTDPLSRQQMVGAAVTTAGSISRAMPMSVSPVALHVTPQMSNSTNAIATSTRVSSGFDSSASNMQHQQERDISASQEEWVKMLHSRPRLNDSEAMRTWLLRVVSISDDGKPSASILHEL